ncbi:MAG: amidohydrolase [Fuerstiella sp.]|nr:amidohydrolase [Fuerstiella sp.]
MPDATLPQLVERFQKTMAHAWMVRTFIKHCDEIEDYPELMGIVRSVFDMSRAIESKTEDPPVYFRFAEKKIGKLRKAAEQFQQNAWSASTHTNFQQAVRSVLYATEQMEDILAEATAAIRSKSQAPSEN